MRVLPSQPACKASLWFRSRLLLKRMQWMRGVRAGVAVAGAMIVCRMLRQPMGWAALGGFEAILVDNGGPYRSRLETMGTLMTGGAVACIAGALVGNSLWKGILVSATFCFAATFARVASERIASTSVIILVLYFAGFGSSNHTLEYALRSALQFVLGGVWAAVLSLILWPVDPFRPVRDAVAACYRVLADFSGDWQAENDAANSPDATSGPVRHVGQKEHTGTFQREMRLQLEVARRALGAAPARVTARTVRARNLSVLLETADMLFATTLRWREIMESNDDRDTRAILKGNVRWLSGAERAIWHGLMQRPGDNAASYLPHGSHSLEHVHSRLLRMSHPRASGSNRLDHLSADERDALENIQIAFEAIRAMWTGAEIRSEKGAGVAPGSASLPPDTHITLQQKASVGYGWTDALRANWTFRSTMMRHALRMAVVGGLDVLLMRLTHVRHGSWLAMTSIIVLQPYGSGTLRRGMQRTGGTIAGGLLAAALATAIRGQDGLIAVITVVSVLTLATYAVNYAWYCFFLTPTFVLMSMPYFRDWQYAEVRMANTVLGALVAVFAMRLLWPEREHLELGRLLGRGAAANASYLESMLQSWKVGGSGRTLAERQMLAPARRLAGLAINDAEESLDRMMLEPGFGRRAAIEELQAEALTFVTYLRRLMRVATILTAVGSGSDNVAARVTRIIDRLQAVSAAMMRGVAPSTSSTGQPSNPSNDPGTASMAEQQMRRMERQTGVLERTAAQLLMKTAQ